ncbi:MAG: hypothetical protein BRD55_11290 [Bacteroidetes bacterium SW_9_63_38]|nr:MAG: hypothetical protein BRD55_11290 [Bacteroidetes bacterium SW_9_63_38]
MQPGYGQAVGVGAFSRLTFDARGLAMGNALVGDAASNVSPYYNPALLPNATRQRVSGSAALMAYDRQLQSLEFTTPLGPAAGVGVGVLRAGVSNIDGRNTDGERTETLSTDEFAVSLSFGNRFWNRLSVGVNFTLYQSDVIPDTSPTRGLGIDIGATYRVTSRLTLAGSVNDLLAKYDWDTSTVDGESRTDRFPIRVLLGGSYEVAADRLQVLAELESRYQLLDRTVEQVEERSSGPRTVRRTETVLRQSFRGRMGVEYRPIDILALRLGVDRIGIDGTDGVRPGAGFGLRQSIGELDLRVSYGVAMEPYVRTFINMGTVELFL